VKTLKTHRGLEMALIGVLTLGSLLIGLNAYANQGQAQSSANTLNPTDVRIRLEKRKPLQTAGKEMGLKACKDSIRESIKSSQAAFTAAVRGAESKFKSQIEILRNKLQIEKNESLAAEQKRSLRKSFEQAQKQARIEKNNIRLSAAVLMESQKRQALEDFKSCKKTLDEL